MSVSTTEARKTYNGDGVSVNFATPYFLANADLKVYVDGVLKTITTDYSVSGAGVTSGGTVTMLSAPVSGTGNVVIIREPDQLQSSQLPSNDPFPSKTVETMIDKLTMLVQRLFDKTARTLSLSDSDSSSVSLTLPSASALKFFRWNASANAIENVDISTLSAVVLPVAIAQGGTGATTAATARAALAARGEADDVTLAAGKVVIFEGATDDTFETTLTVVDPTADQTITLPNITGQVAVQARGTDIASASTINLTTATGDIVDVTGTTAITAITLADGLERKVRFTGALTLTNGASLVLPSGANIATAAGDFAVFRGYAAGVVRCVSYTKASGQAVSGSGGLTLGTAVATTSGTSIDFTSLPSTLKRITINFDGVSTNGTSNVQVQIGDSGGIENTGYQCAYGRVSAGAGNCANITTGFGLNDFANAGELRNGSMILTLLDASTNTWSCTANVGSSNTTWLAITGGTKSLSATLDRVRITTVNGTDTFDAGKINIAYE